MTGLAPGHVTVRLRGSAGQSLGAFAVQGLKLEVLGEANDYVGKGLSGAQIVVRLAPSSTLISHQNTIIGNTCLYGATAGELFAAGQAGERFAVRNSGATAVVEGCGSNGCEYMTGGTVVILGAFRTGIVRNSPFEVRKSKRTLIDYVAAARNQDCAVEFAGGEPGLHYLVDLRGEVRAPGGRAQ